MTPTEYGQTGGIPFQGDDDTIVVKRRKKRRRSTIQAAAGLGAVILAAGVLIAYKLTRPAPQPPQPCAACMSDGSRLFDPGDTAMTPVMKAIAKENAAVRANKGLPYVTVALLAPLTVAAGSDATPLRLVDQLRAAYLAQLVLNSQTSPLGVQLLLFNEGTSTEGSEGPAVSQLLSVERADRVVAVAGLGVSNSQTATSAQALDRDGMAMFASVTSANRFNAGTFPDMDQMVPDVSEQIAKLHAVIPAPRSAVLVYDQQTSDYYTADLRNEFSQAFGKSVASVEQPFTPGSRETNPILKFIADEVCYTQAAPPTVFYAGRESVLAPLIQILQGDLNCQGKKITLVTGADADGLSPSATAAQPGQGQVSVIYSDITNLNTLPGAFTHFYKTRLAAIDPGATGLTDTWTVETYDSMMAAWTAIQQAYSATKPGLPGKADVVQFIDRLFGESTPAGADGAFAIGSNGMPVSPDIPVFEDVNGSQVLLHG